MPDRIDLDHVAIAAERAADLWPRYRRDLGGEWVSGHPTIGFAFSQLQYANGMRVEMLEPHLVEQNDFLRRFLDRLGPGPHHLTFKVPDIVEAIDRAEAAGFPTVNVDLSDPGWKEAFLYPKQSLGIVVQLAQSDHEEDEEGWRVPEPDGFPVAATDRPASLVHVAHAVRSLDEGVGLFGDLLGGKVLDEGPGWVELVWPGPGRVRLVTAPDWVGDRPGRIHHVAFACPDPAAVPDARPLGDGSFEVAPGDNLGTRLVLSQQ